MEHAADPELPRTPIGRLAAFFRGGQAGGMVLMLAALAAVVWANSPWSGAYAALIHLPVNLQVGARTMGGSLELVINDGLMAVFFLLVGLEIRREMAEGQLASLSRAAAPAIAALGGMILPALIYLGFAQADPTALPGWAIPMATDIAFSLAVLRALGRRVPTGLRVFLTALAIIDDLAAIIVIAVFYSHGIDVWALGGALVVWAALFALARAGVRQLGPYLVGFVVIWVCLASSGVHPTLAGVAVAFAVPLREVDGHSPAHTLEHELLNWVAYLVLPLFGLANAGLVLGGISAEQLADPVVPGIFLGLFFGKQVGVVGFTWAAVKLRLARLPAQLSWGLVYGAALLCGIGFTMSLFIGHLAFPEGGREAEMKLAIFAASILSAVVGLYVLSRASRKAVPSQTVKGALPQSSGASP